MTTTKLPTFTHGLLSSVFNTVREHAQTQSRYALCAAINHVLKLEPQVQDLLKPHINRQLTARWPAKWFLTEGELVLRITHQAQFEPVNKTTNQPADVTVSIQEGFMNASNQERLRFIRIEGDALLAQALGQVAQRLRWDAEHDLAQYIGDIPAVWLVNHAKSVAQSVVQASQRLHSNIDEYLAHESTWFTRRTDLELHKVNLTELSQRISQLEQKLRAKHFQP